MSASVLSVAEKKLFLGFFVLKIKELNWFFMRCVPWENDLGHNEVVVTFYFFHMFTFLY